MWRRRRGRGCGVCKSAEAGPGGKELQCAEDLLLHLGLLDLLPLQPALLFSQHPHGQSQAAHLRAQGLHLLPDALPQSLQGPGLVVGRRLPPLGLAGWVRDADAGVGVGRSLGG